MNPFAAELQRRQTPSPNAAGNPFAAELDRRGSSPPGVNPGAKSAVPVPGMVGDLPSPPGPGSRLIDYFTSIDLTRTAGEIAGATMGGIAGAPLGVPGMIAGAGLGGAAGGQAVDLMRGTDQDLGERFETAAGDTFLNAAGTGAGLGLNRIAQGAARSFLRRVAPESARVREAFRAYHRPNSIFLDETGGRRAITLEDPTADVASRAGRAARQAARDMPARPVPTQPVPPPPLAEGGVVRAPINRTPAAPREPLPHPREVLAEASAEYRRLLPPDRLARSPGAMAGVGLTGAGTLSVGLDATTASLGLLAAAPAGARQILVNNPGWQRFATELSRISTSAPSSHASAFLGRLPTYLAEENSAVRGAGAEFLATLGTPIEQARTALNLPPSPVRRAVPPGSAGVERHLTTRGIF